MWTRGAPRCASVTSDQAHISISSRGTPEGRADIPSERRRRKATSATPGPPGHLHSLTEGDLILGAGSRSAVATLVERTTRYVALGHLPIERTADAVRDSIVAALAQMPAGLRRTLTWDQGAEMSEHRTFTIATNMAVYFCEPASPWQRGTNENTNGLLRQYLPKRSDLSAHDLQALTVIAEELNGRPRKSLDWDTPAERMAALLDTT